MGLFFVKRAVLKIISILLILSNAMYCFANFKIDGAITRDELNNSKIQLLCNDSNSGNGLTVLSSLYNISPDERIIYIGLNLEFGDSEIQEDEIIQINISIDNKPEIKIFSNGDTEYDEYLFSVEQETKNIYSSCKAEAKIIYKFPISPAPKITIQIIDTHGLNSKIFEIDTFIPQQTTLEQTQPSQAVVTTNKTKKEPSKNKSTHKSSSKNNKTNNDITQNEPVYEQTVGNTSNVILDSNIKSTDDNKNYKKMFIISVSLGLLVAVILTLVFINVKYFISKSKDDDDKKDTNNDKNKN